MVGSKDPFETFSNETLQRAEEMCAGLSSHLSLDRRGQAQQFSGAISDLDDPSGKYIPVLVAEVSDQPRVALISEQPLEPCRTALLVFRLTASGDMKYVGRHGRSRPGQRHEDHGQRHVVQFDILRDARRP